MQELAQLRRQTRAMRIGGLSLASVMLAAVAAPGLLRQPAPVAIPRFEPYRTAEAVSANRTEQAAAVFSTTEAASSAE